jgi:hypothetical protein
MIAAEYAGLRWLTRPSAAPEAAGAALALADAAAGTPIAITHASVPSVSQSSYVRIASPRQPQLSPQEFCTTKPVSL